VHKRGAATPPEGGWNGAGDLAPCGGKKHEASGKAMSK